jgi:hypothetical protein
MDDTADAPGQHPVEVGHQLDIVAIVSAQVGQVIGEGLALGEVLLEG